MNYVSKNYKDLNMNIIFSTPSEYLAALEAEKKEFPVFTGDLIQLADANIITNGYYSSKPDLKRAIKTASAEQHVQNKIFAQQVLRKNISAAEVSEILSAK